MQKYTVLVRMRYDKELIIKDVENFGRAKDCDPFFFIQKNGVKSFIPIAQVVFIGHYDHWYSEPYNEEDYK